MQHYKHVLCSCARMEEDSIVEWIAYHQSVGFDHFFIYGNDDDYRTLTEVLAPFIVCNLVTFVHCPELGAQTKMYFHFLNNYLHLCEWFCFLDHDEFIRLDGFNNSVENLTRSLRDFDSIQFNWICYGTSGFEQRPRGSVLRQYTKREEFSNFHTKQLTRTAAIYRHVLPSVDPQLWLCFPFWHAWPTFSLRTCSALFDPVSSLDWHAGGDLRTRYETYVHDNSARLIDRTSVAHFMLKSRADFERRVRRGIAANFSGQAHYQNLMADSRAQDIVIAIGNAVEDFYLANYWESYSQACAQSAPFQWGVTKIPSIESPPYA